MKKFSLVSVVLLLTSLVAYGQESGWRENGSNVALRQSGDKVGIGTSSPSAKLDIANVGRTDNVSILVMSEDGNDEFVFKGDFAGSGATGNRLKLDTYWGNNVMTWRGDGNVGIGITNPLVKLHVNGDIRGNQRNGALRIQTTRGYLDIGSQSSSWCHMITDRSKFYFNKEIQVVTGNIGSYTNYPLNLRTDGITRITINHENGNVGIGINNPQSKLAVNGTITAKKVKVTLDGWSDFIFADDYRLMPLDKLEKHIKKERSLPGIPTEKEVLKGGVELGEMQAKLLEKVEELTLYVIELKKENTELKERISLLEK